MRFLFLIHGDAEAEAATAAEELRTIVGEHIAYATMLRERGVHVLDEALTGEAVTVRPGERPLVTDGPFAETKEAVGGFYVVDCASREDGDGPPYGGLSIERRSPALEVTATDGTRASSCAPTDSER